MNVPSVTTSIIERSDFSLREDTGDIDDGAKRLKRKKSSSIKTYI